MKKLALLFGLLLSVAGAARAGSVNFSGVVFSSSTFVNNTFQAVNLNSVLGTNVAATAVSLQINVSTNTDITSTLGMVLMASNDGANWSNVATSSATYTGGTQSFLWDLGPVNYQWLAVNTQGTWSHGVNFAIIANEKSY